MEDRKINVSIKVWIYILLAMAACWAVLVGLSRTIGGPGAIGADKYHMITTSSTLVCGQASQKNKNNQMIWFFRSFVVPLHPMMSHKTAGGSSSGVL